MSGKAGSLSRKKTGPSSMDVSMALSVTTKSLLIPGQRYARRSSRDANRPRVSKLPTKPEAAVLTGDNLSALFKCVEDSRQQRLYRSRRHCR